MLIGLLLLLAGVVVLVVALSNRPVTVAPEEKPSPSKLKEGDGDDGTDFELPDFPEAAAGAGLLPGLGGGGALTTGLTVGGGLILSGAGAYVGGRLTGDVLGTFTGGANFTYGTVGNTGRVIGRELDVLLGGTGTGTTGSISQTTGFFTGTAWAYFGWAAGISLALTGALIYAIAVVVTDLMALAFGQKGAREEYERLWNEAEAKFFRGLLAAGAPRVRLFDGTTIENPAPPITEIQAKRFSVPMADGYMAQANKLAFLQWKSRDKGIGQTLAGHMKFGQDRGKWCGEYSSTTPDRPVNVPAFRCWGEAYATVRNALPAGARTLTFVAPHGYLWELQPKPNTTLPSWATAPTLKQTKEQAAAKDPQWYLTNAAPRHLVNPANPLQSVPVADYFDVAWVPNLEVYQGISDVLADALVVAGRRVANLDAWVEFNKTTHGAFKSNIEHAQWGADHGHFEGVVGDDGSGINLTGIGNPTLTYDGAVFDMDGKLLKAPPDEPALVPPAPPPPPKLPSITTVLNPPPQTFTISSSTLGATAPFTSTAPSSPLPKRLPLFALSS